MANNTICDAAGSCHRCMGFGREHSNASLPCIRLAANRMDVNSLMRQHVSSMKLLFSPLPAAIASVRKPAVNKLVFIQRLIEEANAPHRRCGDRGVAPPPAAVAASATAQRSRRRRRAAAPGCPLSADGSADASFDVAALPYRWLPGLPVVVHPAGYYEVGRFEVMHMSDHYPGPLWLYAAPGSGVWLDPGRRMVAPNLISAILRVRSMGEVLANIHAIEVGDRRLSLYRAYVQWRTAFANHSWEEIVRRAAADEHPFSLFAMAGKFIAPLLTDAPPKDFDTIILTHQTHLWPRGASWPTADDAYAPAAVQPCAAAAATGALAAMEGTSAVVKRNGVTRQRLRLGGAGGGSVGGGGDVGGGGGGDTGGGGGKGAGVGDGGARLHMVPEVIDFRAVREAKRKRAGVPYYADAELPDTFWRNVYASRTGARRCNHNAPSADVCTSCSAAIAALCECALAVQAGARRGGRWYRLVGRVASGPLLKRSFNAEAAQRCCVEWKNRSSAASRARPRRGGGRGGGGRAQRSLWAASTRGS